MTDPGDDRRPDRRPDRGHLGAVALSGLATAGLSAAAASRSWVDLGGAAPASSGLAGAQGAVTDPTTFPLASAVSLVLLACWGVLLVTRGRVRRAFAVLAVVVAGGLVATVVGAAVTLPGSAERAVATAEGGTADASFTVWFVVAALAAVLALVPTVLAVRWAPRWPEMGSRYDAPAAASERMHERAAAPSAEAPVSERDLWRSLDEGLDPTEQLPDERATRPADDQRPDQAP